MTPRERWQAFADFVATSPPLDDVQFRAVLARLRTEPDEWLRRACIVTLVRSEREVASDAQLREIAMTFGGKIAEFAAKILARRATTRAPAPFAR